MRLTFLTLSMMVVSLLSSVSHAKPDEKKAQTVGQLIKLLKHGDLDVENESARRLIKLGPKAVPALIKALRKQPLSAYWVPWILAQIGEPSVAPLTKELGSCDPKVRIHTIKILTSIGQSAKRAVPGVVKCLSDRDARVQRRAVTFLTLARDDRGVAALTKVLRDGKDEELRREVIRGIYRCGPKAKKAIPLLVKIMKRPSSYTEKVPEWVEFYPNELGYDASFALAKIGPASAKPLVEVLADRNTPDYVRVAAAYGLFWMGAKAISVLPDLIPLVQDPDEHIRDNVLLILDCLDSKDKRIISAVKLATKDRSPRIRLLAAGSLYKLAPKNRTSLPVMLPLLTNKDVSIRALAAACMGGMGAGGAKAVPALAKSLLNDKDSLVRSAAARALGEIGPKAKKVIPALRTALTDTDPSVQEESVRAIERITGKRQDNGRTERRPDSTVPSGSPRQLRPGAEKGGSGPPAARAKGGNGRRAGRAK